jgi:hypothetical protein
MNMKAAASLTGSLLARKGAAYPAAYSAPTPSSESDSSDSSPARAYNDPRVIASAPPAPTPPQAMSTPAPQHGEQFQDGRPAPMTEPAVAPVTPPEPAPISSAPATIAGSDAAESVGLPQTMDKMGRVRLSVRLDPDRYLRVKMASARTRWSAQDIVIAALDRYLGGKGEANDDGDNQGNLN